MFSNYLLTALRHFLNNPLTSVINVLGLSIGFTCFVLISMFIDHETSYDTQFSQAESIYRLNFIKEDATLAISPFVMAETLKEKYPQVEAFTRINRYQWAVKLEDRAFNETLYFADKSLFTLFDFLFVQGDRTRALDDPFSIVLSEDKAIKFFGRTDVLGEVVSVRGYDFKVTGIIDDDMGPTVLPLDIVLSGESVLTLNPGYANFFASTWYGSSVTAFLKLNANTDIQRFTEEVSQFVDERAKAQSPDREYGIEVEPLLDLHLHSKATNTLLPNGSINVVYAFTAIAILILALACINFMNLATAQATQRAKEVGVRKSLGAYKSQLITQFIGESVIISVIAFTLSLGLVAYLLPYFNDLLSVELTFSQIEGSALVGLLMLSIAVGIVAGCYPAFYLSAFNAAIVLKGNISRGSAGTLLRKGLVILQFAIASGLIVGTLVIHQQMALAKNVALGYDRDSHIRVRNVNDLYDTFKNQLLTSPAIESVVKSHVVPTEQPRSPSMARLPNATDNVSRIGIYNNFVSYDFFNTFDIKLIAGRVFSKEFATDELYEDRQRPSKSRGNIVVNREMATQLGKTPEEMVGQTLFVGSINEPARLTVVGVVESSYYKSIHTPITPMAYYLFGRQLPRTTVKFKQGALEDALKHIDNTWSQLAPGTPINRSFLDDDYNALYQAEQKQSKMLTVFSVLAIIITCLGLFGLATFTTQRRIKEVGIRKVLGASRWQISWLITSEFTTLVVISNLIAWPVAYIFIGDWLTTFANRIELTPLMFVASAVVTVCVAWVTVGGLAFSAASTRPVNSLRSE